MLLIALLALVGCAQTPVEDTGSDDGGIAPIAPAVVDVPVADIRCDDYDGYGLYQFSSVPSGISILICYTSAINDGVETEGCRPFYDWELVDGLDLHLDCDLPYSDQHFLISYW